MKIEYSAVPTIAKFHLSDASVRGIKGPIRSGKSTGCSWEIWRRVQEQRPSTKDNIRKSRFAIVRNTYRELQDTTLKTWLMWFSEEHVGPFNYGNMTHKIKHGDIETEILFRALDRPADVRKLLSMELTGAWVNEAREVPKSVIDMLIMRVGQYPPKSEGGCTWQGVIMDTNPPDEDHWWYELSEKTLSQDLPGWEFFNQPGALIKKNGKWVPNPKAENIKNLNRGIDYYLEGMAGKSLDFIAVYFGAEYGYVQEGKPIYPDYSDALHCATEIIKPTQGVPIYVGIDFGLTPAALLGQRFPNGRWIWFDELVSYDMGAEKFANLLGPKLRQYHGFDFKIFGDPAGEKRAETDERTCFQVLNAKRIPAEPAPSNNLTLRIDAVTNSLTTWVDGKPRLQVSPNCIITRAGMAGRYCLRRVQLVSEERYHSEPIKNKYSHVCEAGQYMMLGAGEGETLITRPTKSTSPDFKMKVDFANKQQGWMGA